MHPNEALARSLYEAFQRRDGKAMAACYSKDATFRDPVFPALRGKEVGAMWRMLCSGAKDLDVTLRGVVADDNAGSAQWEATYTFSRSGRRVHNRITANFEFAGGKIVAHVDSFPFWRWSRQALGPVGWFLGWTPFVRAKVRRDAAQRLQRFMDEDHAAVSLSKPRPAPPRQKGKAGKPSRKR